MKRLLLFALAVTTLGLSALVFQAVPALADARTDICSGVGAVSGGNGCSTPAGSPDINSVINNIVNIFSAFVGVLAVIMIIYAGFRYVTAGGDSGKVSGAKTTLIYAIVGLVVAGLAQVIVKYVIVNIIK